MTLEEARELARFIVSEGKQIDNSVIQCIIVLADYIDRKGIYESIGNPITNKQIRKDREEEHSPEVFNDSLYK